MNSFARRTLIGTAAGGLASIVLALVISHAAWAIVLGIAVGAGYSLATRQAQEAYVDSLMAAAAFGIPLWGLISVIAVPFFAGRKPEWDAEQMRAQFPALIAWILYGGSLGLLVQAFNSLATRVLGPEAQPRSSQPKELKRILILGGGFGGMRTAACLEQEFRDDRSVSITLVSQTNALLFTPMLAEVAGGSLDASHISPPLRSSLHRAEFVRGRVEEIDLERGTVRVGATTMDAGGSSPREFSYDHLVLALGAVSNYLGMTNVEKLAFNFKSLFDAIRIRNHIIEMFERADRESDPSIRGQLLTFVVAGGGFAGVELAGSINDFAHGILADYPNLRREEVSTVLVHSRDRILPELSESLARYAQRKMEARGVIFRLETRLVDAMPGVVVLSGGVISARTLVWTAGTSPNPLLKSLPIDKDKRGAVAVDATLAATGRTGIWALGDCAAVNDAKTHRLCPPTAQFALREAKVLAGNIRAAILGGARQPFHFDSLGALCVIGHQTACAEFTVPFARNKTMRFSGLLAWLMWRGIYLAKLPGLERKIRVLMDWTIELFFPRDIVQTMDLQGK
jgi:NADH:ubiquinone reductase (H+-translocating)